MYTTKRMTADADRFAELIRVGQYAQVNDLDTTALADAILNGPEPQADSASFCAEVSRRLWTDQRPVRFTMGTSPGVMRVLGLPADATIMTYTPEYGMTHKPLPGQHDRLRSMWLRTHFFRVTPEGVRYAGQVTYEQMLAVSREAAAGSDE